MGYKSVIAACSRRSSKNKERSPSRGKQPQARKGFLRPSIHPHPNTHLLFLKGQPMCSHQGWVNTDRSCACSRGCRWSEVMGGWGLAQGRRPRGDTRGEGVRQVKRTTQTGSPMGSPGLASPVTEGMGLSAETKGTGPLVAREGLQNRPEDSGRGRRGRQAPAKAWRPASVGAPGGPSRPSLLNC